MNCAYVKSGDVLAEYERIRTDAGPRDGGPLVYLSQFLEALGDRSCLLLGTGSAPQGPQEDPRPGRGAIRLEGVGRAGAARKAWRIFRALMRARPGVAVCGERNLPLLACLLAMRLTGGRLVFSSHNTLDPVRRTLREGLLFRLNAFCLRRAAACLCHGPYLTHQMARIRGGENDLYPFDRGMDDLPAPKYPDAPGPDAARTLLFVGRMEREKGVFDLLAALHPSLEADPRLRLVYVGDGPALAPLRDRVRVLRLDDQVRTLGRLPHTAIAEHLDTAFAAVTPTRSTFPEGRPMAATEALHFGLPVVAPDLPPFAFFVRHEQNGLLFRPDDAHDLRAKLERLLHEPDLRARLSEGARRTPSRLEGLDDFATAMRRVLDRFAPHGPGDLSPDPAGREPQP